MFACASVQVCINAVVSECVCVIVIVIADNLISIREGLIVVRFLLFVREISSTA